VPRRASFPLLLLAVLLIASAALARGSRGGPVRVRGYIRRDGTFVRPHLRSAPDGRFWNNWKTRGNINPYTGQEGTALMPPPGYGRGSGRSTLPVPPFYVHPSAPPSGPPTSRSSTAPPAPRIQEGSGVRLSEEYPRPRTVPAQPPSGSLPQTPSRATAPVPVPARSSCRFCKGRDLTTEACSRCQGRDLTKEVCPRCKGADLTRATCIRCGGRDLTREECLRCRGRDLTREECTGCRGAGRTISGTCSLCSGRGKQSACSLCAGQGRQGACYLCSGRGKQAACYLCDGTGKQPACYLCEGGGRKSACLFCAGAGVQ
jgi:hypothetical protein